jgi:hypothetical protein
MHSESNSLKFRYFGLVRVAIAALAIFSPRGGAFGAEQPPYAGHFNPANGFKPAQRNLTAIFLQMAGSLEHFGSPEPYMRHVLAEHARIDAKYRKATGKPTSCRPEYLTDDYVEKLVRNWNKMAPSLSLEPLARQSGKNLRYAIMGTWNMAPAEKVSAEAKLTPGESTTYRKLLEKQWFEKPDFKMLDAFYADGGGYDKLSEFGKSEISKRVKRGQQTPEKRAESIRNDEGGTKIVSIINAHQKTIVSYWEGNGPETGKAELRSALIAALRLKEDEVNLAGTGESLRDPIFYAHEIKVGFTKRIDAVREQAKQPGQADTIIEYLVGTPIELLTLAQMEYELGLAEDWADRKSKER